MIFIYDRFGSVLFGSVRLEYLSFGIRYFGILPASVHYWTLGHIYFISQKSSVLYQTYVPKYLGNFAPKCCASFPKISLF